MKMTSIEMAEGLVAIANHIRNEEKQNPGTGYAVLEEIRKELPEKLFQALKATLDNPQGKINVNIHYK